MTKRVSAIMRQTWYEAAKRNLSVDERVAFFEAVFDYQFYDENPARSKVGDKGLLMFDMIRDELAEDKDKYRRMVERNRTNGSAGGRPVGQNMQQKTTNPVGFLGTHSNPLEPNGTQREPIHNNTIQDITRQAATAAGEAAGGGGLDLTFFEQQIWPRLNQGGAFNSRHRKCQALWAEFTEQKRSAITKAVLSDAFAGKENPYFYLQDFAEPGPQILSPYEVDSEWKAGRSVFIVKIGNSYKPVRGEDVTAFGLKVEREAKPM